MVLFFLISLFADFRDVAIVSGWVVSDFGFFKSLSSKLGGRASGSEGATTDRVAGGDFGRRYNSVGGLGFLGRGVLGMKTIGATRPGGPFSLDRLIRRFGRG